MKLNGAVGGSDAPRFALLSTEKQLVGGPGLEMRPLAGVDGHSMSGIEID